MLKSEFSKRIQALEAAVAAKHQMKNWEEELVACKAPAPPVCLEVPKASSILNNLKRCSKNKENTMRYSDTPVAASLDVKIDASPANQTESNQRSHLEIRLRQVYCNKYAELREHFKLDEYVRPTTPEDLIERIKKGEYKLRDADHYDRHGKPSYFDYPIHYFEWNTEKDEEGFAAASKKLEELHTSIKDDIVILPPTEGLAKLREFESATFH